MSLDKLKCVKCGKNVDKVAMIKRTSDGSPIFANEVVIELGVECGCYKRFQDFLLKHNIPIEIYDWGFHTDFPNGELFQKVFKAFIKGREPFVFR